MVHHNQYLDFVHPVRELVVVNANLVVDVCKSQSQVELLLETHLDLLGEGKVILEWVFERIRRIELIDDFQVECAESAGGHLRVVEVVLLFRGLQQIKTLSLGPICEYDDDDNTRMLGCVYEVLEFLIVEVLVEEVLTIDEEIIVTLVSLECGCLIEILALEVQLTGVPRQHPTLRVTS